MQDDPDACAAPHSGLNLADALQQRTQALHRQAERAGVVGALLRGTASRQAYALLLRNLLPAYRAMEAGLEAHRNSPAVGGLVWPALYRRHAIEADLAAIAGASWRRALRPLPAGARYAGRVREAGRGDGARLIAHAYTRYLGDLSGGQILRRLLARSLGLGPEALAFYAFPEIEGVERAKAAFRAAIDDAGRRLGDTGPVLEEAMAAFELNIALSLAVDQAASADAGR